MTMYNVILYYNFGFIENPQVFCKRHKQKCDELNLKGRVYISQEGINGTLAGRVEDIESYKKYLCNIKAFAQTEFKEDASNYVPFDRLIVKVRREIVALKVDDLNPREGGAYLSPQEWRAMLESDNDYVLIDVRNDYETKIGHFKGALTPPVKNFYDFPNWLDQSNINKNRKILMYCTGGIRCEKFSVFMKQKGWTDVNQLHGGIIRYAQEEGGKHFKGKCFVFDDRLVVEVNPEQSDPIAHCEITGVSCDSYINCANMDCNRLFICSPEGAQKLEGCCCEQCMQSSNRRPLDLKTLYQPFRKWYKYFPEKTKQQTK